MQQFFARNLSRPGFLKTKGDRIWSPKFSATGQFNEYCHTCGPDDPNFEHPNSASGAQRQRKTATQKAPYFTLS
jgi:hypothetical protein